MESDFTDNDDVDHYKQELFNSFITKLLWLKDEGCYKKIKSAFDLAYEAHSKQKRKDGTPYITHPVEVAKIVSNELGLRTTSVVAALLHDVVEDCDYTIEDIKHRFGKRIAAIVDGVTKISKTEAKNNAQFETMRKLLLSIPQDFRVVYIKLADRIHNMRTMACTPENTWSIKTGENLHVFVPIAEQLGFYTLKNELEDNSFRYRLPEIYTQTSKLIDDSKAKRINTINQILQQINQILSETKYNYELLILQKSKYSVWVKMEKGIPYDEIHNVWSIRVVFDQIWEEKIDDQIIRCQCYDIFTKITNKFEYKHDKTRDWILHPKTNGFSALVFDIYSNQGKTIELQITTRKLHEIAEFGHTRQDYISEGTLSLIRRINENLSTDPNALALLEDFPNALYTEKTYVFSPKNDIIELPKGSTVLDYAFYIHTELGLKCIGAQINDKAVPRNYILQTTDHVKILTSNSQKPDSSWIDILTSQKARTALKSYLAKEKKQLIEIGKIFLQNRIIELNIKPKDKLLEELCLYFDYTDIDELYFNIANETIDKYNLDKVIRQKGSFSLMQFFISKFLPGKDKNSTKVDKIHFSHKVPLIIDESFEYILSKCCRPIPGDDCIAYLNDKIDIQIHKKCCKEAKRISALDGKRTTTVVWKPTEKTAFLAKINLSGTDRIGMIRDIINIITNQMNVNIESMNILRKGNGFEGIIGIYVFSIDNLNKLIEKIRKLKGVKVIHRENIML